MTTTDQQQAAPKTASPVFHLTDLGNSERLCAQHGDSLRYCHASKRWYCWDGMRWKIDETGEVDRKAVACVRQILVEASKTSDTKRAEELASWALKSQSEYKIRAMKALARSEGDISVHPDDFDRDPWLLTVLNGTLDLRTGELKKHRPGDNITRLAPVPYDPQAECPRWETFLQEIMNGDEDRILYLQRIAGYSLTGSTQEQATYILYGTGSNGKSTFVGILGDVFGDYARQVPAESLMTQRTDRVRNDLAMLKGTRLATASESEEGRYLAEALVKQMSGNDRIAARFLYGEYFDFTPEFKLLLSTNHKPIVKGCDIAIWRRLKLLPFDVRIPDEKQDKQLTEKLRKELPGVLRWAVEGCLQWQGHGLGEPQAVTDATTEYRNESDPLAGFLTDCCELGEGCHAGATAIYDRYREWTTASGEKPRSQAWLGRKLTERGLDKTRDPDSGRKWYLGIGIKEK